MNRKDLIDFCLTFTDVYEDYPFSDDTNWVTMRHKTNKKIYAMFFDWNKKLCANLKSDPMRSDFLRGVYEGIIPAYHMNKTHWNTVFINEVPKEELFDMITHSYNLTAQKMPSKRRKNAT